MQNSGGRLEHWAPDRGHVDSLPPGSDGPPQHIHRKHTETFYVVSGTVRLTSGSEHVDVSPGGLVTAPIGVPHTFSNPDPDQWATFACTVAPDLYIGYFRDLAALRAESGGADKVSPNTDLQIMARYATEPYTPPGS
ncbi:cupin domain-containing protein [Micromonospora sp. NPDC048999]|uniref:cupin domain-containing protein n=1 Tax=Micromonospora sp. NPDC048999 TaxID=3155391 RepID=UPI0033DE4ACE